MTEAQINLKLKEATLEERLGAILYKHSLISPSSSIASIAIELAKAAGPQKGWEHIAPAWLDGYRKERLDAISDAL